MFKRTLFTQSRMLSTRALIAASPSSSRLVAPSLRRLQVAPPRILPRQYSTETKDSAEDSAKPAEDAKERVEEQKSEEPQKDHRQLSEEIEAIRKELEKERNAALDYKDKFTRVVADFRNLQDRTEKDKRQAREFAIQKFAKDLVESVDNLDRALQAVPEEAKDVDKNKHLMDLYSGLTMTEEVLLSTMKKHGLEKVDPMGQPFDPTYHEAIFLAPMEGKEPNTVFHVQQTGFTLNGRTIRAAKVGVVSTTPKQG